MGNENKPAFLYLREGFEKIEVERQVREIKENIRIIELNNEAKEKTPLDLIAEHYAKQGQE